MGSKDVLQYLDLYKAASLGNWGDAKKIFDADPEAIIAKISTNHEIALHVAVASSQSIEFVRNLANLMSEKEKTFRSEASGKNTVLHYAATAANTEAAKIIVGKDPSLHMAKNMYGHTPLHVAAQYGHKDTTWYLYSEIQNEIPRDFDAAYLLNLLIMVNFYDIAIVLLKRYPKLALEEDGFKRNALSQLAQKPQAFPSGIQLSYWQRVLSYCSSMNEYNGRRRGDIENPTDKTKPQSEVSKGDYGFLKGVNNIKLMQDQALELLKLLIDRVIKSDASTADKILEPSLKLAARNGIHEFVTEVIKAYPASVSMVDEVNNQNIFDVAVIYRQEKVYNLLYQMGPRKHFMMGFDKNQDTMLHLAAKYESRSRINRISGAALQMQRELQWFKEVEQLVQPSYAERTNKGDKLPADLFTESHQALVQQGEKWMKETAKSCTIVATLVVTIVFAAAFTIPGSSNGGDNNTNNSNLLKDGAYMAFVISNALALFSSATSLLMFLGILTSRYSVEDFLMALPMRLAIGLITLFFSIASMLVAFSAALHLVLVHQVHWIAVPIGLLACIPVTLFAFLQFPLLVEIVASTFGPSIFGKKSDELLI